jgi:N-acetylmuramoyl-L-alanine amidase
MLGGLVLASPAEAAQFESWRFNPQQNQLVFTTDSAVQPRAQFLSNPARIVIDLPGTTLEQPTINQAIGGSIQAIRIGQFDAETTRVTIELSPDYAVSPEQIVVRGESSQRWTIELPSPRSESASGSAANQTNETESGSSSTRLARLRRTAQNTSPTITPATLSPAVPPLPEALSEAETRAIPANIVIAIDPGHGGADPGAVGIGGLQEKDITSAIAYDVAEILEKSGLQVVLTRADDREINLEPRVQIAQRASSNLFVSIHANSISLDRPEVNGLETYYYSSGNQLAQVIHDAILQELTMTDRGVRQARFYVLRNTSMPAVLVETGFVTGAEDAQNFNDPAWRGQMAEAIAAGIVQYVQQGL